MQRLLVLKLGSSNLSRKLTSNNANSSLLLSHHFKTFTSPPLTKPTHFYSQDHTLISSLTKTPPLHYLSTSPSSYQTISGKVHGFLSNPLLPNRILSKLSNLPTTHFRVLGAGRSFWDCKVGNFRALFARGFYGSTSNFGFYRRGWRSWFNRISPNDMVLGLIIANVAVFLLWRIADQNFMRNNFMVSLDNFKSGRLHTLITSAISHIDIGHLISNMIGLYFFGINIGRTLGSEYLLKLYLAGAIGGSVFYLLHHAYMALSSKKEGLWSIDPSRKPALGASGAVNAILLLSIFLNPRATLLLEFIIPVPAVLLGIFLIGKDLLRIIEGDGNISGSAHLGGAAVAALAFARIKRGRF